MRKQTLLLLLAGFLAIQSSAQIEKGGIYAELAAGRQFLSYTTNIVQPSVSIGISEHSTIGAFYRYERTGSYSDVVANDYYSIRSGGGVSYSYYRYFNKNSKWGWYLNGSLGYYKVSVYNKQGSNTVLNNRYNEKELSITPGVFFKPSPRIMLFANIGGFSLVNYAGIDAHSTIGKQVNVGIRITIGGGKKKQRR